MDTTKLQAKLKEFLKDYPGLEAVKEESYPQDKTDRYDVRCKTCKTNIWLKSVSYEAAGFRFDSQDGFYNRKLEILETEIDLHCECPDKTYALPEDFEISW